jgi:hypothetical protein
VGKFNPLIPMSATMAIEKGCHGDYGVAIFFQQEKRRSLHLGQFSVLNQMKMRSGSR